MFDLFGESSDFLVDPAALRAKDIATYLNEDAESAYRDVIKFPGAGKYKGGIALSTVVAALKPLVEKMGPFEQRGENEFERQAKIVNNFFIALKDLYGDKWQERSNVFAYALGFTGAIEFLRVRLLDYCESKKSFRPDVIKMALLALERTPILQEEIKGLGGRGAANKVTDLLIQRFAPDTTRDSKAEV